MNQAEDADALIADIKRITDEAIKNGTVRQLLIDAGIILQDSDPNSNEDGIQSTVSDHGFSQL